MDLDLLIRYLILGLVLASVIISFLPEWFNNLNLTPVKSNIDGRIWNVQGDLPCPSCAADRLAKTHLDLMKLIRYVNEKFPNDPRSKRLRKYNIKNVIEGRPSPAGMGDTSYVVNKGEKIVHCLRSAEDKAKFVEENLQIYTMVHEASHIASKGVGHGKEFQENFLWLLNHAVDIGIYEPIDYSKYPQEFCGITVNSSILF